MNKIPWVKFYAGDFLNGVAELSPHEITVYTIVLMRIYDEDGPITNDPPKIARRCNMRVSQCRIALGTLINEGKLIDVDGLLDNKRARKEIETRQKLSTNQASKRSGGKQKKAEKPNQNNSSTKPRSNRETTVVEPTRSQKPEARKNGGGSAREAVGEENERFRQVWQVHERCCDLIGVSPEKAMAFATSATVHQWLNAGCDPEVDIYPTLQAIMARRGDPPGSMKYFTEAVARAKATREQPLPDVKPNQPARASPQEVMIDGFTSYLEKKHATTSDS